MRFSFFTFFLFSLSFSFSQTPNGKLYVFTGTGGVPPPSLGYFEYPAEVYHSIAPLQVSDITTIGNKLYAAAYLDVIAFDTSNYTAVDTLYNIYARKLASWGNNILVASIASPFFSGPLPLSCGSAA